VIDLGDGTCHRRDFVLLLVLSEHLQVADDAASVLFQGSRLDTPVPLGGHPRSILWNNQEVPHGRRNCLHQGLLLLLGDRRPHVIIVERLQGSASFKDGFGLKLLVGLPFEKRAWDEVLRRVGSLCPHGCHWF